MNVFVTSSLAIAVAIAPVSSIAANDGSIVISGRITPTACEVEAKPPGTGAVTKTVEMGDISAGSLAVADQTAGDRGFQIHIGGNAECVDGGLAKIRFDPASPLLDRSTGRLNIDAGAEAAKNVQVQIANEDGTPINLYTEDSHGTKIEGNTAVIPLIARYYSTGKAEKGVATSRVGFQVVYQ